MTLISRLTARLLLPAVALICLPAWAAFSGSYAPANWTSFTQTFGCGSSQVDVSGMPNSLVLRTLTGCFNIGAGYSLTGTIPATGTLSFNWSYTSSSAGPTSATYTLAGSATTLASGNVSTSGSVSIPVTAGQSFSFNLNGSTNASLTITGFAGPVVAPVPALDTWALALMAGLLGLTALWAMRRPER